MATGHYSADSARPPHTPNGTGFFKTPNVPASRLTDTSPAISALMVSDTKAYIGETADLARRLLDHISVERKVSPSCIPTPISID